MPELAGYKAGHSRPKWDNGQMAVTTPADHPTATRKKETVPAAPDRFALLRYAQTHGSVTHTTTQACDASTPDRAEVTVVGLIADTTRRQTKDGRAWASATLEDQHGTVEILVFPNAYDLLGQYLGDGQAVIVRGQVLRRDGEPARIAVMNLAIPYTSQREADERNEITVQVNGKLFPGLVDGKV